MNTFKYQMTVLPDFHFNNFIDAKKEGEVSISTSIGIPKDLSKHKIIKCDLLIEAVSVVTREIDIKFKSISIFDITAADISVDTLLKDAAKYCVPIALRETEKKFEEISKILIGQPINMQLSQHIGEE